MAFTRIFRDIAEGWRTCFLPRLVLDFVSRNQGNTLVHGKMLETCFPAVNIIDVSGSNDSEWFVAVATLKRKQFAPSSPGICPSLVCIVNCYP